MSEIEQLEADIARGIQAEEFLRSPLGRWMVARAEQERAEQLETLAAMPLLEPGEIARARDIQMRIAMLDKIQQYLADALTLAEQAIARGEQLNSPD